MGTSTASRQARQQKSFEENLRRHLARSGRSETPGADRIRRGMSFEVLDDLQQKLGLGQQSLEQALGVSARTLQRRRKQGKSLSPATSDRLWRLLHVYHLAKRAFGSKEAARAWMTESKAMLGGETPLAHIDTEPGLREVEDMLTVIDETGAA